MQVRTYSPREPFAVGSLTVAPLPIPHDAAQVALVVSDGATSAAIVTDLGEVPPALPEHLAGCDLLLVEANHDADMLARGPYPDFLKRRIASARGHLSNAQSAALLASLPPRARTVALMHLSATNNREDLALGVVRAALAGRGVRVVAASQRDTLVLESKPAPLSEQLPLFGQAERRNGSHSS
jgi:phosphoribosyl 1,2-cyclic phosphodiesterase